MTEPAHRIVYLRAMDTSIEEFFLRRAAHIDEERLLFAKFAKLVAPSETELLSLSWDERYTLTLMLHTDCYQPSLIGALRTSRPLWTAIWRGCAAASVT